LLADCRSLVGDGDGDGIAVDFVDVGLILLPDVILEILHLHPFLRERDVETGFPLLRLGGLFADGPEFILGVLDARRHFTALMLETRQLLLRLLACRAEFHDFLFRLRNFLPQLLDARGVVVDFARARLHAFAEVADAARDRLQLTANGGAFVFDAADGHALLGQLLRLLFFLRLQFVRNALCDALFLAQLAQPRIGLLQYREKLRAARLVLGILLFDTRQLEHDGMDFALQIAGLGRKGVTFALLGGESDFFVVQFGARLRDAGFDRVLFPIQLASARRHMRCTRLQPADFVRQCSDLRDLARRNRADNAVFVHQLAPKRCDG
jgi:hypothetical protein